MKAFIRNNYGSPDQLEFSDIEKPIARGDEILVKIHRTTVNRTDCSILWAKPFIIRFFTGLFRPKFRGTGTDLAGIVEAVGPQVNRFKTGDRIRGFMDTGGLQSHAEFTTIREKYCGEIPPNISMDQAAASAEAAHYAYHFINKIKIKPGQKILVNGASGAIGSALTQFLVYEGSAVTAVSGTDQKQLIQSMGVENVIDYQNEDFTRLEEEFDYVFDAVGKSTFGKSAKVLRPKGTYVSSELGPWIQNIFLALITPFFPFRKVLFPIPLDLQGSFKYTYKLLERGAFNPLIGKEIEFEEIPEYFDFVDSGKKIGNLIVKIQD